MLLMSILNLYCLYRGQFPLVSLGQQIYYYSAFIVLVIRAKTKTEASTNRGLKQLRQEASIRGCITGRATQPLSLIPSTTTEVKTCEY